MKLHVIVAMTEDGLIGRNNELPWHYAEDLTHFKNTTQGHHVLMGRRSWDAMPGPLPKRSNVVISRTLAADCGPEGIDFEGARFFNNLEDALVWCARHPELAGDSDSVIRSDLRAGSPRLDKVRTAAGAKKFAERARIDDEGDVYILGGYEIFKAVFARLRSSKSSKPPAKKAVAPPPSKVKIPAPLRLVVTWVPKMDVRDDDILFPHSPPRAWIESRFVEIDAWDGVKDDLRFVVYELNDKLKPLAEFEPPPLEGSKDEPADEPADEDVPAEGSAS